MTTDKSNYSWWVRLVVFLLRCWMSLYNFVSYFPFLILINPAGRVQNSQRVKARPLKEDDPTSPYRSTSSFKQLSTVRYVGVDTIDKAFDRSVKVYRNKPCLGTREVLSVEREPQPDGRTFEKLNLGDYKWQSYDTVDRRVRHIGAGLLHVGHGVNRRLIIFAETQANWLIAALACFKYKFPVVTIYATLGEGSIANAINETESETIITTHDLIPKVKEISSECKHLKRIVYFLPRYSLTRPLTAAEIVEDCEMYDLDEIEYLGEEHYQPPPEQPNPDDIAMIMFTSGTTGAPKGVLLSHKNLLAASMSQYEILVDRHFSPTDGDDVYVGYLPLAHVLEVDAELCCLSTGIRIGYSSPLTLTDQASKIKQNARGDCAVLNPTVIAVVPAIMDRIYKAVKTRIERSSELSRALFEFVYEEKRRRLEEGYSTPFLNRLIFRNIRNVLGERLRLVLCGGAPLSPDTQRFMTICFCCPVSQGYGLTETSGGGTLSGSDDLSTGRVGPPLSCNDIMLRDWEEGDYTVSSKPYPQGEILISGANVSSGYLNNPEKTAEDFVKIGDRIWFCTGDIGEFHPDGALKIIDRKKDLVKLQHGEYVSLSKIETAILTCPLVEFVCVICSSYHSFVVALVVPNKKNLVHFASSKVIRRFNQNAFSERALRSTCFNQHFGVIVAEKLAKFEIPKKIHLCKENWSSESGMLTEALKLKRKEIYAAYKDVISGLYVF
ncbi:long chain fatty acid coenzyme A ligase 4 [Trichuris trichiura]|uniref:long-chain-fatty-acid--CoA ligase n=1 Tax=Trichuris trichiura TaxID=36087 RepID=A0A077ZFN0_TRITR|nr:long chain fatty acid coenzyme A ligase 4 [Trichuris trichiura]